MLIWGEEDGEVRTGKGSGVRELWGREIAAEQGDEGARSYEVHPQRPKGSIPSSIFLNFDTIAFRLEFNTPFLNFASCLVSIQIDENVAREIINHRSLRHPNIIRFKEVRTSFITAILFSSS